MDINVSEEPVTFIFSAEVNRPGKWKSSIGRMEGLGQVEQEVWPEIRDETEEVKFAWSNGKRKQKIVFLGLLEKKALIRTSAEECHVKSNYVPLP